MNRIVCAAIQHPDTGDLILGPRHFDRTMHTQIAQYKLIHVNWKRAKQGFIDNHGNFLDRIEAYKVAQFAGQIIKNISDGDYKLYSENLY